MKRNDTEIVRLSAGYGGLRISADNQISVFWRVHNIMLDNRVPDNQTFSVRRNNLH